MKTTQPIKSGLGVVASIGLVLTMATPGYATTNNPTNLESQNEVYDSSASDPLTLPTINNQALVIPESSAIEDSLDQLNEATKPQAVELPPPPPSPAPEPAPEPAPAATPAVQQQVYSTPVFASGSSLLGAALSQIGAYQDCTALVENALRALGHNVGDLGPMGFGGYGVPVHPSQVQPGDIMMRGGHVAIYAGDGVNHSAVHGGWNGNQTVHSPYDADPYAYAQIVRVG